VLHFPCSRVSKQGFDSNAAVNEQRMNLLIALLRHGAHLRAFVARYSSVLEAVGGSRGQKGLSSHPHLLLVLFGAAACCGHHGQELFYHF
jgi:hypothetical protein